MSTPTEKTQPVQPSKPLFSIDGRINRAAFWLSIIPYSLFYIAGVFMDLPQTRQFPVFTLIGVALSFCLTVRFHIKRCHDLNRSGWYALAFFAPILNIVYLIEVGFKKGTAGNNRFGPDPLDPKTRKSVPWYKSIPASYCIGIMAVLTIAVFTSFIFSDQMLFSSDQLGSLDSKVFQRTAYVTHHQFPFWFNPRLGGMPTIDALFGDALYLPSIVMSALLPVHRALGYKMVLHVFLAGLFFFLMLRRGFKCSLPVSLAGGVLYMFNPEFFSHIYPGHDGKMYVIAWVPFIIWRLKALAAEPKLLNATLLALGIGVSLLTSHVQLTYFVLWGVGAYGVLAAVLYFVRRENGKAIRFSLFFCGAVAVGLCIGLAQLLPSFMFVREAFSVRGVDRGFTYAASWSMHWPELFSLWVPEFGNTLDNHWNSNLLRLNPESMSANFFKLNSEYAGAMALLLAAVAVVSKPGKPWRWFWAGLALFAVLFSLGAHTWVFSICYAIVPGVKKFRASSMMMFWFSFGTILLASLFLKDLAAGAFASLADAKKKKWTKGVLIAIGAILGVTILFSLNGFVGGFLPFVASLDTETRRLFDANFSQNFVPALWLWFVFAAAALGLVLACVHGKMRPEAAIIIILAIGAIDVIRADAKFIKLADPRPYFRNEPALEKLRGQMAGAPFRVFSLPGSLAEQQNGEGVHGLEGVGGFHDNELRWYREFRGDRDDRNYFEGLIGVTPDGQRYLKAEQIDQGNAFLNIANVKYLLGRNGYELMAVENKNALGRVSWVPDYCVLDSAAVVPALKSGGYDYRRAVALYAEPQQKPAAKLADSAALPAGFTARWERYSPNDRKVRVTAPADGFLRISEVYYPGWKMSVDGKAAAINRADLAWMAIFIPAGEHVVEMKIGSLYFGKALWVSLAAMLLLCAYWGAAIFARKKAAV